MTRRLITLDTAKTVLTDGTPVIVAASDELPEIVVQEKTRTAALKKFRELVENLRERGVIKEECDVQLRPAFSWAIYVEEQKVAEVSDGPEDLHGEIESEMLAGASA